MNVTNKKKFSKNEIINKVKYWKSLGEEIVFTNGCFDILHYGHIKSLEQAATFGSKLIVALNSDNSIKRIKGENRPIQDEKSRMAVMAALQCVDAVVIFEEDTPENIIKDIIPDVLVKGGDYAVENIVGYDFVIEHGGKVITIDIAEGYSTSNIIKKMK